MLVANDVVLGALEHATDSVGIDTETTGLDVVTGRDYFIGASVTVPVGETLLSTYLPYRHHAESATYPNLDRGYIEKFISTVYNESTHGVVYHNRKFDIHSFTTFSPGLVRDCISNDSYVQHDVMMQAQFIDEEFFSKELDYLGQYYLKTGKLKDVKEVAKRMGFANIPAHIMAEYAGQDTEVTARLKMKLWPMMVEQELDHLWDLEQRFTTALYKMERQGVGVDLNMAGEKVERGEDRMDEIRAELGFDVSKPSQLGKHLFDVLGLPILHHTDKGKPKMDREALQDYDEILSSMNRQDARLILEFRGWQKAVSSLYLPMLNYATPGNKIHTTFKQHGTVTSRLSSEKPNLQQVPRGSSKPWNGTAKQGFNCGIPGYVMLGYDYSQLELRLATAYGEEAALMEAFVNGSDPFEPLTLAVFGEFNDVFRQKIKTKTYATLYGAGIAKVAAQLGMTEDEIRPQYERFKASISGIIAKSREASDLMSKRGYIKYWTGRRRHIKNKSASFKAFNSLLQGGGAEVVKAAMVRIAEEVCDENCVMLLQVHDEIVFAIREDLVDKYEPEIISRMTDFQHIFNVPFAVEGKVWNK